LASFFYLYSMILRSKKNFNKCIILFGCFYFLSIPNICFSQEHVLSELNEKRHRDVQIGMFTLGGWATMNIVTGTIGAFQTTGESKYFHQMNVGWNAVNLLIAGLGYYSNKMSNKPNSFMGSLQAQNRVEQAYLVNSALNLTYITSGVALKFYSFKNTSEYHRLQGFGNSLILQGSFLLIFDLTSYFIHRGNAKKYIDPLFRKIEFSDQGIGLKIKL